MLRNMVFMTYCSAKQAQLQPKQLAMHAASCKGIPSLILGLTSGAILAMLAILANAVLSSAILVASIASRGGKHSAPAPSGAAGAEVRL